ncbi:ribonuclease R [Psychroflexus planctonicus]|uniref:Ribonuclease R n=1 Tax=Psychroflexus planctonicus TaxID=1526575 RepID=A0ABQ1SH79_9FLAO|nr:ribonuclease R [Psychroflexus planctonicus]GGE35373.1 ribonuclease R [Psychroflexus planctonicus]
MSKKKKSKNAVNYDNLTQDILSIFRANEDKTFNYKDITQRLEITDTNNRNRVIRTLAQQTAKGKLDQVSQGKYQLNGTSDYYEGVIDMTSRGDAYVMVEGLEHDILIRNKNLNKAFHKDIVQVYVFKERRNSNSEGEVTKIVERHKNKFVGVLQKQKSFGFVVVQDPKMYTDIFVAGDNFNGAEDGEMVLVSLEDWNKKDDSPRGKVLQVLGIPGEHQTEIHAILAQYGLPEQFPKEVEEFADQLDTSITQEEIKKRKDLRDVLTFTIDPADAKDFDDALSFQVLDNGNYEIGIHIADVSHYLEEGSILDQEAYNRATSIYLVDRVVPMLPEVLSNAACSLRPNEEKYTFSAVFELTKQAKVINQWFGRTVTYSDARFAYEEAQFILDTEDVVIDESVSLTGESYSVQPEIKDAILEMNRMAKIMRAQRMKNGAISFDKQEVKFNLNEDNSPEGVYFKTAKDANKLIEEFMLLANKKVAEFIGKQKPKKTFVYRCHDEPNPEKLQALSTVVSKFGYKTDFKDRKSIVSSLNKLLSDVEGKGEQNLIDTLTIRTMAKAYYSTENIGHYGLAFDHYSHFTSPIRRYPDVMVHRLLQHYLDGNSSANAEEFEERCKHSSNMESLATNAERDSIKYMQVKYMQQYENERFLGVISGVTDFGMFVELVENRCEGMVRVRDMKGDHFQFDQENYAIVGKRTKTSYQLGDEVWVEVKKADLIKRNLDFELIGGKDEVVE